MGVGVDGATGFEQHTAVAALAAADEEDEVVRSGEVPYILQPVGHLAADGVGIVERHVGGHALLDDLDEVAELGKRLGGLRVEADGTGEVDAVEFVAALDNDGRATRLPHEAQHLGVAFLPEDDDLRPVVSLGVALDALLDVEHHGAGGIDELYVVLAGRGVGLGRLAVGTKQHAHVVEPTELLVVDGNEAETTQTLALLAVVDDVAQRIEGDALAEFLFGLTDGGGDTKAEAAAFVNLYGHRRKTLFSFL